MILNRNFYSKMSFISAWWSRRQVRKLRGDKLFKTLKLHKTEWPGKLYFYSPRLKRKPRFIGTKAELSNWQDAKLCETLCPTHAIEVKADAIIIDDRGCIACGICVDFAPEGLLEMSTELPNLHRS